MNSTKYNTENNILNVLNSKERILLDNYSNELLFEKEECIIKINSALHSVYYITEGMVKYKDANDKLFFIVGANDFVGLSSIFNDHKKIYSAYATKDTKIIQIDKTIIKKFILSNHPFLKSMMSYIENRQRFLTKQLFSYRNKRVNGAFASFLLMYENNLKHLTRREIGELIGYSRENISKVLHQFTEENYICEENNAIKITDKEALLSLSKFG